jgi:hypothetical protein
MREEDRVILEEAIRNSAGGDDFDEMLLRATKKHLPRKYHRQFSVFLEEILGQADELGVSNRLAAQSILKRLAPPEKPADPLEDVLARHVARPPAAPAPEAKAVIAPAVAPAEKAPLPEPGALKSAGEKDGHEEAVDETGDGAMEKLPEEQKILDLGGTSPDSLSPEMKEKLRKLVKAQKRKQAWEDGTSTDEPEPGLFFKGQQRAPPFVPLGRPVKNDEKKAESAEKPAAAGEEEDLEDK